MGRWLQTGYCDGLKVQYGKVQQYHTVQASTIHFSLHHLGKWLQAGYRDGMDDGKGQAVQEGFDSGMDLACSKSLVGRCKGLIAPKLQFLLEGKGLAVQEGFDLEMPV